MKQCCLKWQGINVYYMPEVYGSIVYMHMEVKTMGIESVNGVTSYQVSSNTKAVQPVKEADSIDVSAAAVDTAEAKSAAGQVAQTSEAGKQNYGGETEADGKNKPQEKEPTMKDIKDINKIINNNTVAEFGYNEPTRRITIKIKDKETDEVIKEIPSEKALEMLAKAWELAGLMVDEKR